MDEIKQVVSKLKKDNIEMITACFDEYYFIIPESVIKPVPTNAAVFEIGQSLPVKGETYQFPLDFNIIDLDFNIIDLHFKLVGKIRDGRLCDVEKLNEYIFEGIPAVNMMGFAIKLSSQNDFEEFKKHFASFSLVERERLADFANRWFDIFKYRTVKYK